MELVSTKEVSRGHHRAPLLRTLGRTYRTATLLPDGTVLIVGGLPAGAFGIGVSPDVRYAHSSPELFKPWWAAEPGCVTPGVADLSQCSPRSY